MIKKTADTIVVGGGLHGCSTALHLAMRGMNVLVIEKTGLAAMPLVQMQEGFVGWGALCQRCRYQLLQLTCGKT